MSAVTLDQLLRHMELYYSDRSIAEAMDSIYEECSTQAVERACRAYAKARRQAPGFDPSRHRRAADQLQSNHSAIAADTLRRIREGLTARQAGIFTCRSCGSPFEPKRKDARYCSATCRQRFSRASRVTALGGKRAK